MTITIRLDVKLEQKLRKRLDDLDVGLSEFVRQAIAEKLEKEPETKPAAHEAGKHLFGRYGSGRGDLSVTHEQMLRERLRAKHRG